MSPVPPRRQRSGPARFPALVVPFAGFVLAAVLGVVPVRAHEEDCPDRSDVAGPAGTAEEHCLVPDPEELVGPGGVPLPRFPASFTPEDVFGVCLEVPSVLNTQFRGLVMPRVPLGSVVESFVVRVSTGSVNGVEIPYPGWEVRRAGRAATATRGAPGPVVDFFWFRVGVDGVAADRLEVEVEVTLADGNVVRHTLPPGGGPTAAAAGTSTPDPYLFERFSLPVPVEVAARNAVRFPATTAAMLARRCLLVDAVDHSTDATAVTGSGATGGAPADVPLAGEPRTADNGGTDAQGGGMLLVAGALAVVALFALGGVLLSRRR